MMWGRCVMVVVAAVVATVTTATTSPPPTQPRSLVKMVTSAPRPEALVLLKDCPVYVLGELRGVKKHGDTWHNDGSACELCKCVDGQKRCYYYYCNGATEGFMTPPSGGPPLDDEDRDDGGEEGSGRPPLQDEYYKVINHPNTAESWGVGDEGKGGVGVNDVPPMCGPLCDKFCPWGFKLDKSRGCLRCKCHKCSSMAKCHIRCLGGLAKDARGCHMCACRSKGLSLIPQHHHPTPDKVPRPDVNTHTQSQAACNDTGVSKVSGVDDGLVGSSWSEPQPGSRQPGSSPPDSSSHHRSSSDGTTRSAVQASPVEWWQVWVIATPLVLVLVVLCGAAVRYWRRYHHDKYHINAYRPTETEKLRPVTTADDHHHNHNNQRVRHL